MPTNTQTSTHSKLILASLKKNRSIALTIVLGMLIVGGVAATYLAQTNQDIRQQAAMGTYIEPTPTKQPANTPTPTKKPSEEPTATPTKKPTGAPTITPTKDPTKVPTKTPTVTPTKTPISTPTPTPGKVECGWCGTDCLPVDSSRACIAVAPPTGYICMNDPNDSSACRKQAIECVPKPSCMFADPACEPDLLPYQVLCADSDLNHDMLVDGKDYALLSMHFFDTSPAALAVDINRDGKVDIFDYSTMVKEWTR